jgi:RimJ/RimL family protein N-acetyltransferase
MGLGREAERLTIAKAFDEFGAHKVYGRIPATNEGAKKAVASLGWQHEGTLRSHISRGGQLVDLEMWGVLPEEFRAATADR